MEEIRRPMIMCKNGLIASGHHLASLSGVKILMEGGNAIDAAIATAAVLCVVRPHMTSIGGDAFMLIYSAGDDELRALNASGPAPLTAAREYFLNQGMKTIPATGMLPVSVPGIVDGWVKANERYGTMRLAKVLQPAIEYAENGFPVYPKLSAAIRSSVSKLLLYPSSAKIFLRDGQTPNIGENLVQKDLAKTLKKLAVDGADFYQGEIALTIANFSQENNGLLSEKDFKRHQSKWYEPISTTYRGYTVFEQPPVSQGHILLQELNIVEGFELANLGHNTAEAIHLMVEAKKLVFEDRIRHLSDPDFVTIPLKKLLSKEYAAKQRARISMTEAMSRPVPRGNLKLEGDTTYFAVVDKERNAVSFIESLFQPFGSGVVVENTGILLNNRMISFSLAADHVNRLEPGKKTAHTLNNYMVFKEDRPFMLGGTPGADDQVQTNLQVIANVTDYGMSIQQAIEAPRWSSRPGTAPTEEAHPYELWVEKRITPEVRTALAGKGHRVKVVDGWSIGGAQGIVIDQTRRVLMGGADPRRDGYAIGW
jgi:gamma-glutamyltranspeptidase/glutathione hydrolase